MYYWIFGFEPDINVQYCNRTKPFDIYYQCCYWLLFKRFFCLFKKEYLVLPSMQSNKITHCLNVGQNLMTAFYGSISPYYLDGLISTIYQTNNETIYSKYISG